MKIPLHHQLLAWRKELVGKRLLPLSKRLSMKGASFLFRHPKLYSLVGRIARFSLRHLPRWAMINRFNTWSIARELPAPPRESFSQWYAKNRPGTSEPAE